MMKEFRVIGIAIAAGIVSVFLISVGLIRSPPKEMKGI